MKIKYAVNLRTLILSVLSLHFRQILINFCLFLVANRRSCSTEPKTPSEPEMSTISPSRHHPAGPVQQRPL